LKESDIPPPLAVEMPAKRRKRGRLFIIWLVFWLIVFLVGCFIAGSNRLADLSQENPNLDLIGKAYAFIQGFGRVLGVLSMASLLALFWALFSVLSWGSRLYRRLAARRTESRREGSATIR